MLFRSPTSVCVAVSCSTCSSMWRTGQWGGQGCQGLWAGFSLSTPLKVLYSSHRRTLKNTGYMDSNHATQLGRAGLCLGTHIFGCLHVLFACTVCIYDRQRERTRVVNLYTHLLHPVLICVMMFVCVCVCTLL